MNAKHNWTNKSKINNEFNAEKKGQIPSGFMRSKKWI